MISANQQKNLYIYFLPNLNAKSTNNYKLYKNQALNSNEIYKVYARDGLWTLVKGKHFDMCFQTEKWTFLVFNWEY